MMSAPSFSSAKKSKTYHYHSEWEEEFFFVMFKDKCLCLICNSKVALPKRANVERHFKTTHTKYATDFPFGSEGRKIKVRELKSSLSAQQSFFTKPDSKSKAAALASFAVAEILIKRKKPFEDGELIKEAMQKAGEALFNDFKNKKEIMSAINDIPLSRNTVMRRSEALSQNLEQLLKEDLQKCSFLSLQFDESTDVTDIAELCIFVRLVFEDMTSKEEFLTMIQLKGQTRGEDIYRSFKEFIEKTEFPIHKLVAITTDGAPAMLGQRVGFTSLCKNDVNIPSFTNYHCIIHQQVLCSKILDSDNVMKIAFKIVNSIRARSLQRRQFRALLEETEAEHSDLLLHTDVRWLSRGAFLKRFRLLLPEIKTFIQAKGEYVPELQDEKWLMKLAFLTDTTEKLNELNKDLQGKDKTVIDMTTFIKTFKSQIQVYASQLRQGDLRNFKNMEEECTHNSNRDFDTFISQLENLRLEFQRRFSDFDALEDVICFMTFPFNECVNLVSLTDKIGNLIDSESVEIEEEIIKIRCDIFVKARAYDSNTTDFWKLICKEKYPCLRKLALYLTSFFGSTYLCESTFSNMNAIKTKHRSRLTDSHLTSCLRIAVTSYTPQYDKLVTNIQCQVSTQKRTVE